MTEHVGPGGGRVLAVLGYSGGRGARLHPVCAERLAHAERLAPGARAIILSGGARRSGSPEAELMRAAWAGPAVRLICDPEARSTADNAVNIAAAVRALGAEELVVVTSRGIDLARTSSCGPRREGAAYGSPSSRRADHARLSSLAREVVCLALLPFQLARLGTRKARLPPARPVTR